MSVPLPPAPPAPEGIVDKSNPFTHYYAQLLHQGNMLQDHVRTGAYQRAFLSNGVEFKGKVVLDVGTGTGILAFFALQAGAKRVYGIEASDAAEIAQALADANGYTRDQLVIIKGKVEEIPMIPEKVDIIISEPIGFLLVHERMLESYAAARNRFLKPGGLMMPTTGSIILAPVTDDVLYKEQLSKIAFWSNDNFYGINLTPTLPSAQNEYFSQPIVGYFPQSSIISPHRTCHTIDFSVVQPEELHKFDVQFKFKIDQTAILHAIGGWFDINFLGSAEHVQLSTAPDCPGTHWYQCRLLLKDPIAVNKGQTVSGTMSFTANDKFSYFIDLTAKLDGTDVSCTNRINLHDQAYHYLYAGVS